MLCDRCKKEEACLHIRGIDQDGRVRSLNLCAHCAMREIVSKGGEIDDRFLEAVRQATQEMGPEILDMLQKHVMKMAASEEASRNCPVCGKRYGDFQEDCSLGCRECFKVFSRAVRFQLDNQFNYRSLARGEETLAGAPGRADPLPGDGSLAERNIQRLRKELDLAVRREEYENAAAIQRRIKDAQEGLLGGATPSAAEQGPDGVRDVVDEFGGGLYENHRLAWLPRRRRPGPVVALSSFVGLDRNLDALEIPPFVKHFEDAGLAVERIASALAAERLLGRMRVYDPDAMERDGLTSLHEHGWCRPEFLARAHPRRIVVSENERIVCLLNDGDHLGMTFWGEAGQFPEILPSVRRIAADLSVRLTFWKEDDGYVTRNVRNIGTGIRMGGILHLPALTIANQVGQVAAACGMLGVTLAPFSPEMQGQDGLYVFANASSRNADLAEIAAQVRKVQDLVVAHELECRKILQSRDGLRLKLCDLIGRAWGIIGEARLLPPKEGRALLSLLWLGVEYGMLPALSFDRILQGLCDLSFYDMGVMRKRLMPGAVQTEKILASRFRHDIAGVGSSE